MPGLLGIARRAGAVVPGVDASRKAIREGSALLAVMAADAAPGQLAKVKGLLEHREIPVRWVATRHALGRAVGRPETSVVVITRHSFAEQLLETLPAHPSTEAGRAGGRPKSQGGFQY